MSTFVLIHGAWHGGWAWDKVAPVLRQRGHAVHTPDLPGHGNDTTPVQQVTLQAYVDRVLDVIDRCSEPVVLAGHSMGGIVISQAAEQRPDSIRALVYVCAFLLQDGQTLLQMAEPDREALVMPNLVMSSDQASATVKPEVLREVFYEDCSDEDYERAKSLLVPQAAAPLPTPIHITAGNFGRIPRVYVECLRDKAISLSVQREMHNSVGCEQVFSLDSSHSPYFSMPQALADCLLAAAKMERRKAKG
jgi:pimeloyl-ACP methyl ester carboxylesterase